MPKRKTYGTYKKGSVEKEDFKEEDHDPIVPTKPKEEKAEWFFTEKEGGKRRKLHLPNTPETIARLKRSCQNPVNWRRYHRHPLGGDRNYTILKEVPPFSTLSIAEMFFPDGTRWSSRTRSLEQA